MFWKNFFYRGRPHFEQKKSRLHRNRTPRNFHDNANLTIEQAEMHFKTTKKVSQKIMLQT